MRRKGLFYREGDSEMRLKEEPGVDRTFWVEGMIKNEGAEVGRLRWARGRASHSFVSTAHTKDCSGSPGRLFENPKTHNFIV